MTLDLVDLPVEVLNDILDHAYGTDIDPSDHLDKPRLVRLLLVSRKWYQVFLAHVYSSWSFNSACHTYRSLWCFLRTVLTRPHIADLVQTLNVGNWGHGTPFYLPHDTFEASRAERSIFSEAIRSAGIHHLEDEIQGNFPPAALELVHHRPLMALLLVNLPNVSTMYAHIPDSDPYLKAVLGDCLNSSMLDTLQELYQHIWTSNLLPASSRYSRSNIE
jgi:hypothetical protein